MNLASLTQKLTDLSKTLATLDPDSDEYFDLESEIFDLEEAIEAEANVHSKYEFD